MVLILAGAGISTSAGIGDFRGKSGKWTERDREKTYGETHDNDIECLNPSLEQSHMLQKFNRICLYPPPKKKRKKRWREVHHFFADRQE